MLRMDKGRRGIETMEGLDRKDDGRFNRKTFCQDSISN